MAFNRQAQVIANLHNKRSRSKKILSKNKQRFTDDNGVAYYAYVVLN